MNTFTTYQGSYPVIESRSKPEHFNNKSASIYEADTFDPILKVSSKFIIRHINSDTEEFREVILSTSDYYEKRFYVGLYPEGTLHVYRY